MKSPPKKYHHYSNSMHCCSYIEADPVGKYLICATDVLINIALLVISVVYVEVKS